MILRFILYTCPALAAGFFSRLVIEYYSYYDIGINRSANTSYEIFFVMPISTLALYTTLILSGWIAQKSNFTALVAYLFKLFSITTLATIIFLVRIFNVSDYPTERKQNLTEFLGVAHIIKIDFPKISSQDEQALPQPGAESAQ